jgi:hypothetical protein
VRESVVSRYKMRTMFQRFGQRDTIASAGEAPTFAAGVPNLAKQPMTASSPTIEILVGEFLQRLGAADVDGLAELFAERIPWSVPGDPRLPWTGDRSRRSDVAPYFHGLWHALVPGRAPRR